MTGDPKRWLSEAEGSIERELLASVRDVAPPAGAKDEAWRAIAATALASSIVASTSTATAAAAKTSGLVASSLATKAMVAIAAGGIAVSGYYAVRSLEPREDVAPRPAIVEKAAPAPEPLPTKPEAIEAVPQLEPEAQEPEARRAAPRGKRRDLLVEESALLTRARAALRAGDAASAERMLQRMTAEFPRGVLEQERLVLEIEVLAARGKREEADTRARRFADAYPSSPHTARLRSLLDTP